MAALKGDGEMAEPDFQDTKRDADIGQISYVPDAGHADFDQACLADNRIKTTRLTTEEGDSGTLDAWLGGERSALLMQSSGVGNCINMLSIIRKRDLRC